MTSVRALILDFGEVLVRHQSREAIERMAGLAGLGPEDFHERYWRHRPAYDCGLSAEDYWRRVLEENSTPVEPLEAAIADLREADAESWTDYREEMWTLTRDFRARGGKTAFLSNGIPEVMERVRSQKRLDDYFDVVLVSYEVGFTKPDPRIYQECLRRLGAEPGDALFVDDRLPNIDGAARLGIRTLHFTGAASIPELRRQIGL
jgi:putative hydrolase of the HAD superfamily